MQCLSVPSCGQLVVGGTRDDIDSQPAEHVIGGISPKGGAKLPECLERRVVPRALVGIHQGRAPTRFERHGDDLLLELAPYMVSIARRWARSARPKLVLCLSHPPGQHPRCRYVLQRRVASCLQSDQYLPLEDASRLSFVEQDTTIGSSCPHNVEVI